MIRMRARTRFGYALGGIASGTYGTVPGLILMPYLTDLLGVEAAIAGLIVFIPKAWDFFLNPIAGRVSDRSPRPDRRRPFLLRAGVILALTFAAMFFGPSAPPVAGALWVLALFVASATAYAFFQVPYLALSAEITDDYGERTRLVTWRVIVFTLAILVSGAAAPALVEAAGGLAGYRIMAGAMSALILVGTVGVWWGTRGAARVRSEPAGGRLRTQLAAVLGNPDARLLVIPFVLQAIAMGMVLSGVIYVARHVFGDASLATTCFVCFVAPAILLTPVWAAIGRRLGKRNGFAAATVVQITGFIGLFAAAGTGQGVLLAAAAVVGVGYAGGQLFPLAMLPDIAADDAKRSGLNRIGMIAGVWSGFELLGYALGPALLGATMSIGGYVASTQIDLPQTDAAKAAIVIGVSLAPALLCAVSLVPLSRYTLDARLRREALTIRPESV
ncbi:GPH family glycoside/pentoside/hexuronide:cation symporter [Microbacterium sp. SORGH_AS428]|uniref:MFS transporter n=1 Tax=Microbacterium sp. SORGH_AS_0428 TaxID=3041788 RepID=UPI00285A9CD1|nr:MFS transporter [Microbacterium sp. SORGH_AS_0428]MDR6199283.1 GPH family glycoside/pentoside/hexuronide:cation symporter [Microbacterium sp. SORGH_AS_0428]